MSTPPQGRITLLFSDIEDSTPLVQRVPDHWADILAEQRELLRRIWTGHGGYVVHSRGEEFFVVFQRATDAACAAVEAQRALAAHRWPADVTLRMRIGLHTGTPIPVADDYVGLDVHRGARIMAAGYGGQVLASQSTYDGCLDALPPDIGFVDLGLHRFKGLAQDEHLYQLAAPGLEQYFPPPRSLGLSAGSLPVQPTALLGRESELSLLADILGRREVRLLTLIGPGGTGKTRLALEAVSQSALRFADGVCFVKLATVREAAAIPAAIARALDLPSADGTLAPVIEYLRERRFLLLLDNFEQVLDGAVEVAALMAGCAGLKVVVTSRELLRIRGESVFFVAPLGLPGEKERDFKTVSKTAAVRLFVERAAGVRRGFELTPANAGAVAEICARLDGLPLAIELVAARSKLLSPEALLRRLSASLDLAVNGARDLPERHQSLRAAVAWSYDLLPLEEQALFRHLCVFAGGFTYEAAEAVAPEALCLPGLLDWLEALVAKSLVNAHETPSGETRFTLLETLRDYGLERLAAAGETGDARTRHLEWFRERSRKSWFNEPQQDHVTWLSSEETNLREVLHWAAEQPALAAVGLSVATAAGTFWWQRAPAEGVNWITALLAKAPDVSAHSRSRALYWKAFLSTEWASPADVVLTAESCLSEARRVEGSPSTLTLALNILGDALINVGDHVRARRCCEEAVATARALGDRSLIGLTLGPCGIAGYVRGDFETAGACWRESCDQFRSLGDTLLMASPLNWLALLALKMGDWGEAERLLSQCAGYLRSAGDLPRLPQALPLLADLRIAQGDTDAARALVRDAIDAAESAAVSPAIAAALITSAKLASLSEHWEGAAVLLAAARAHARTRESQLLDWERVDELEQEAAGRLGREAMFGAGDEGRGLSRREALRRARKESLNV